MTMRISYNDFIRKTCLMQYNDSINFKKGDTINMQVCDGNVTKTIDVICKGLQKVAYEINSLKKTMWVKKNNQLMEYTLNDAPEYVFYKLTFK